MKYINFALKKARDYDSLLSLIEGFNQDDNIQIKWYGSRRFKLDNHEGTVSLNHIWAAIEAKAKIKHEPAKLQKIIHAINDLDNKANRKLQTYRLARKLNFIPHLLGSLFFNREKVKKNLVVLISGSNNSASKPLVKMNLTNAQINQGLFFQIHAGKFGGKHQNKFELKPALDFVHEYLVAKSKLKPDSKLNRIISKLEKAQALILALGNGTFEGKFQKAIIEAFKKQEPLLIPGGWVGRGHNHAIYYEVIPTTQNEATIRFYDVTTDAEYQEFDQTKLRVLPYTELKGINREKLLSPELGKAVKELLTYENYKHEDEKGVTRIPPVEPEETLYVRNDIYQSLKNLLKPEDTQQPPEIPDQKPRFMTPPEEDVSPYRSLMAFLNAYLSFEEYKQLKVELKMESFSLWPQSIKENHHIENIRLLEKSLRKTSHTIEELAKQKILDKAFVIKANDTLKSLASWLDANGQIKQAKFDNIKFRKLGLPSFKPLSSPPNIAQELKNQKADSATSSYSIAEEIYSYSQSIQEGNVEVLSKVEELCKNGWDQKEYLALQVGLERLIFDLPSDDKFWARVFDTKEKAKQGIVQLGTLGDYYFKTCFMTLPAQTTSPEKYLTVAIIRMLQQHCLKSFSPGNEYYSGLFGSKIEFFPDKKISTKCDEYRHFLSDSFREKSLFSKIFTLDQPGAQTTLFYEGDHPLQGFKELFSRDFDQECHEKFLKWKQGKENSEINYIKFFASEELPDWLKALRNTHISVRAMLGMDLNVIADPERPFEFKFSVETGYRQFRLHSKLTGIETPLIHSTLGEEWEIRQQQRYLLLARPFASQKIQTFYRRFVNRQDTYSGVSAEKEWLTTDPKEIKVDLLPEEYQELMQLFGEGYHGQYDIQTVQVLDYFARHPEKFKDPDFQTIFQKQFFHRELKNEPVLHYWKTDIKKKAQELLLQNYRQMNLANEIQPAVFLLQMMRYLNEFLGNKIPLDLMGEMRKLLTRPGLTPEEKSVIYAELTTNLSEQKILNHQDKQDLLIGLAFLERYPVPTSWRDPKVEHSLRKAPHILSNTLVEYISSMTSDQINQIVKTAYPDEPPKEWQYAMQGSHRVFTSGKSQYFPLRGVLFLESQQAKIRALPKAILESPDFERIFPNTLTGQQVASFIYSFQDAGREVLIKYDTESQQISIEQNFDGQWATLLHKNRLLVETLFETISRLTSKSLVYHFSAWEIPSKNLLFLVDPKSGELKYRCVNEGQALKVTRLTDQLQLNRPFEEVEKNGRKEKIPNSNFMRIEDPSYIHEWVEGDQLKEVELPRFGLTFTKDSKNPTCFHCHQLEGYSFNPNNNLPKLGVYSRYLILENHSREKKALFPHGCHLDVVVDSDKIQTLAYIVFDVTKEGLLQSPSIEENLFAAQVLTFTQEYSLAADYLQRFGPKLRPYSKKESHQLKAIASSKDQDPNAKALRTYASYLLLKNGERSRTEFNKAAENFRYYLSNLKHATALKLSKEEEIFLLKTLLNQSFDPVFFLRLKELDLASLSLLKSPDLQTLMVKQQPFEFSFPHLNQLQRIAFGRTKPEPIDLIQALFTRVELELKKKFFEYYDLAKNANSQERHWLTNALSFNRNFKECSLGNLLEVVLKYPDAFPALPSKKELEDYQWHQKIIKIAEDLYATNRKAFEQKTFNPVPPTLKDQKQIATTQDSNPTKVTFQFSYEEKPFSELAQDLFISTPQNRDRKTFIELSRLLESWKSEDNTFNSELQHQIDDLDALVKLPPPSAYQLKESSLEKIEALLAKDEKREQQLGALEQEILTLANHAPQAEEDLLYHELQVMAGTKRAVTLDALMINFGQQDSEFLKKNNPALTDEEIARLYGKICDYLLQATHEQQRVRCLKILELVKASKKGSLEEAELVQLLGESLLANRHFNPQEIPVYLVFEYYLNIKIREAQIEKISKIQPNTVTQMLMGEGKTTVLYQLEGLLRADGTNTSLLVLPEFLFASVAGYSQKVHFDCFGKKLHTFHFDRNTTFTQNSLEIFLDNLKNATNNRECLITTSKSIACLILKYIELSVEEGVAKDRNEKLMEEILTLLEVNGYPLIDEIDTILRVLHEISFSIGKLVPVDECEYITVATLYDILYTDPEIKNLAYIESDPFPVIPAKKIYEPQNGVTEGSRGTGNALLGKKDLAGIASLKKGPPALTEDLYHKKIKPKLVEAFIERLQQMQFESEMLEEKLQNFGHSLSENEKALLRYYLSQDEVHLSEAQAYFNSLDPEVQNIVALAGEEICRFLPYTLNMNSDEHYGFNKDGDLFTTPFAAADAPQVGSEFKNSHITMNTTFQMYIKNGIPLKVLERVLHELQRKALQEFKENPSVNFNTETWKTFNKIKGDLDFPLLKYNSDQLHTLQEAINQNVSSKSQFVIHAILPHLKRYDSALTFNPQNFIAFFDKSSGFSGTLPNARTMHHLLNILPEAGTDAKSLKALFEKCRKSVTITKNGPMKKVFDDTGFDFDVLIDAGGYCKGKHNSSMEVARLMAAKSGEKVIVYDEKGVKQAVTAKETKIYKEDLEPGRKTLFDQSRSTGGDIKQAVTAVAVMTIGKKLTRRDLFQAARRMRGLDKGQTVRFWISEEVESIIREVCKKDPKGALDFDDILYFANYNQAKQLGTEYFKAYKQQLWNISQMMLLKARKSLPQEEAKKSKELLRAAWVKLANKMPKDQYGQLTSEVEASKAMIEEKKRSIDFIEECFRLLPSLFKSGYTLKDCLDEADKIENNFAKLMPPKLRIKDLDDNQTTEQETETETELEVETELETDLELQDKGTKLVTISIKTLEPISDLENDNIKGNYMPLELLFGSQSDLKTYATAFEDIHMTLNVLQFSRENPTPGELKMFGPSRTPLHNFAIGNNGSIILLSRNDAQTGYGRIDFRKQKLSLDNINLCDLSTYGFNEEIRAKVAEKIVKIKFLNGECNFNKSEQQILQAWLAKEGAAKMRNFYLKYILAGFPLKRTAYNSNSDLKKIFKLLA